VDRPRARALDAARLRPRWLRPVLLGALASVVAATAGRLLVAATDALAAR